MVWVKDFNFLVKEKKGGNHLVPIKPLIQSNLFILAIMESIFLITPYSKLGIKQLFWEKSTQKSQHCIIYFLHC